MAQSKTSSPFASFIKIKGIHFLPPLISEKKRIELQQYKQQAIKLEKRLKNCRELKRNLQELLNFQPLIDHPQSEITFKDDGHVEALRITEKTKDISILSKNKHIQNISLTKDIIDVTEYNNDGIKMIQNGTHEKNLELNKSQINNENNVEVSFIKSINNNLCHQPKKCENDSLKINQCSVKPTVPHNIKKNKVALSETNNIIKDISPEKSPRPRLIRSNSYTLDSPSPILLAHLEKHSKNGDLKQFQQLSQSRNWCSLENNYIPFENSNFSSINTVYNNEDNFSEKKDVTCSTPVSKTDKLNCEKISVSPVIEVIQTDISVQQITLNTDTMNDNASKNICDISDPNSQLMQILQNIPEIYSKQIIELIKNQELNKTKTTSPEKIDEQCINLDSSSRENPSMQLIETCSSQKSTNGSSKNGDFHHEDIETDNPSHSSLKSNMSNGTVHPQTECEQGSMHQSITFADTITSVSPSQSIHYSITSSDTYGTSRSPSVKLLDLESDSDKNLNDKCDPHNSDGYGDILKLYIQEQINKNINVSRELFPQLIDDIPTSIQTIKQECAASVIGAHVKGYLTRRLLKTERVQTLIDTIKDALICALQLHNAENIDESDVELHRRLINQVSAACYAFHDIFFNLSIQEQMSVISTDRQRKFEKATRPVSAPGSQISTSASSRSSSKQRFQTQSKSLTKV